MKQKDLGVDLSSRRTPKPTLLDEIEQVIPWGELLALTIPHTPAATTERPPFDLTILLRIHCMQQWFGLSDLRAKEALFETDCYRDFVGISSTEHIPDRIYILRFRYLLEKYDLYSNTLQAINSKLVAHGVLLKVGMVVDANLIAAHNSTKNSTGVGDLEILQVKEIKQKHFNMDANSGLVTTAIGTTTNVNGMTQERGLLHREEPIVLLIRITRMHQSSPSPLVWMR